MVSLNAKFDGKVLIPEDPVDLPKDRVLRVFVESSPAIGNSTELSEKTPLQELGELLDQLPFDSDMPTDSAAQHDHYLYGTPKRP